MNSRDIPLPEAWPDMVRRAVLHAASLARWTMIYIHARDYDSDLEHVRSASAIQQRVDDIALLKEQLRIILIRMAKTPPKNRPHYPPQERMAILAHKAARGWNSRQTAKAFGVTEETISNWMRELEQQGEKALVQIPTPLNKYPDFLTFVTQQLKTSFPGLGDKKIAEFFARAGLHCSATTVGRRRKKPSSNRPSDPLDTQPSPSTNVVTAKHPNHVWHLDLTTVPISGGFFTTWTPWSLPQRWPFCWWLFLILDHFSRKCIGFAVFAKSPSADDVLKVLDTAVRQNKKPKYVVQDKGAQFWPPRATCLRDAHGHAFLKWCKRKKIKPRFGAVGQHGSIAVIERFIKTLKDDCTRQIFIPHDLGSFRREIALFVFWYNAFRPHLTLKARTPQEVYSHSPPLPKLGVKSNSTLPDLELHISHFEERRHLPVIELRRAA